jgi:hypothetical protein
MNPRLLLLVAWLVSPAWSEEPAAESPAITPGSFDLSSDSVRKIVRDSAAAQSALIQVSEEKPVEPESTSTIKYVPPTKEDAPVKRATPRPAPEPQSHGILSALAEMLVAEALGVEDELPDPQVDCPWPEDLLSAGHNEACRRR